MVSIYSPGNVSEPDLINKKAVLLFGQPCVISGIRLLVYHFLFGMTAQTGTGFLIPRTRTKMLTRIRMPMINIEITSPAVNLIEYSRPS